jgi:hypothetical protein
MPTIIARQRLDELAPAETNTQAATEKLLAASFLLGPCQITGNLKISSSMNFLIFAFSIQSHIST